MDNASKLEKVIHLIHTIPLSAERMPQSISLAGDSLGIASDGKIRLYNTRNGQLIRKTDFVLQSIILSPCERFVACSAADGRCIEVQDLRSGEVIVNLNAPEPHFRSTPLCFWGDWLLYSLQNGVLGGVNLIDSKQTFRSDSNLGQRKFLIEQLIRLNSDVLGIIGYDGPGEKSDFVALDFARLLNVPTPHFMDVLLPKDEPESATTISFAPLEENEILSYQDFGEATLDGDEEFNGFLIRDLNKGTAIRLKSHFAESTLTGAPMLWTPRTIALGRVNFIDLIPLHPHGQIQHLEVQSNRGTFYPTPLYAMDSSTKRIAVYAENVLQIYQVK
jgi:hypothetical protein